MSVIDRLSRVVKSEVGHLLRRDRGDDETKPTDDKHDKPDKPDRPDGKQADKPSAKTGDKQRDKTSAPPAAPRAPAVSDVAGALRVLELDGAPTLGAVRARYRELAERYYPKTLSDNAGDAQAAHVVVEALTDALELLEEHLLPLPPAPGPR